MPNTSDHTPVFLRRLDRLVMMLARAHDVAVVGSFAAALAAAILLLSGAHVAGVTPLSAAWGGAVCLLLATATAWLVDNRLATDDHRSSRLKTCLRLERSTPALGEQLSRAVGLSTDQPPAAPHALAINLREHLKQAALAEAAAALAALHLRRWLLAQVEFRLAAGSLLLAVVGWTALGVSWASGPEAWRNAIAMQFWEAPPGTEPLQPSSGQPLLSTTAATEFVYRRTLQHHTTWRSLAASTERPDSPAWHAAEAGLAADAALAVTAATRLTPDGVVLQRLAQGLSHAAHSAASNRPAEAVLAELPPLLSLAQAAARLAETVEAAAHVEHLLAVLATESAGQLPAELTPAGRSWRGDLARDLRSMELGMAADQTILVQASALSPSSRASLHSGLLTEALAANQLFTAARHLGNARGLLQNLTARLGMPPLAGDKARDTSAVARRHLQALELTLANDERILARNGSASMAADLSPGGERGPQLALATTVEDVPDGSRPGTSEGLPASGDGSTQPAAGQASASTAVLPPPQATPTARPSSVWIPLPKTAPSPPPQAGGPPEPTVSPAYFRRLLDQAQRGTVSDAWAVTATSLAWWLTAAVGEGDQPAVPPDAAEAAAAVERGVAWLVAAQQPDGSWGSDRFRGSVAVTAHGLLALASTGSTALAGPQAEAVARSVDFLLNQAGPSGLIAGNEAAANGPMYGHAYAVQALAELAGETARPELTAALRRGCRLMEQTQNEEGGWRYQPRRGDADISVTAAMVVALEAAAAAGIEVSHTSLEQAVAYLKRLQNTDGGFRYQAAAGPSGAARTAAALVALALAAPREADVLSSGRAWLGRHPAAADPADGYAAYGMLAHSITAWQTAPETWAAWYAQTAPGLLARQRADGSWPDPSCAEYGTAAAILSLTTANGLLPGWKRGQAR